MIQDNVKPKFSWPWLFFITGLCFILFCIMLWFLDDQYSPAFLRVGIGCIILGGVSFAFSFLPDPGTDKHGHKRGPGH